MTNDQILALADQAFADRKNMMTFTFFATNVELIDFAKMVEQDVLKRLHLAKPEPVPVAWEWVNPDKGLMVDHNEPPEYEEAFEIRPLYTKDQL